MSELESQKDQDKSLSIWDRSPAGRWIARTFSFELIVLSLLMIFPILKSAPLNHPNEFLQDPDMWWHLANARHLFAHGFIHIEPYSFSVAGKPWINPEWLAEVPFWLGFSFFGLKGLLVVAITAVELNVLAVYLLVKQRTGHEWSSLIATAIAILLMSVNFGTRTILWGYLCMAAELAILEAWKKGHRRFLWILPPLFALWINVHGSWAIGAFVFFLFAASHHIPLSFGDFHSERRPTLELRQIWIVCALCIGAVFINPYGWRLVWYPMDMMFHQKLNIAIVQEWQPLHLSSFIGKVVVLVALLFVITNAIRRRRWGLFEACVVAFGLYAAVDHIRFCFLFALLAMPSLAFDLHRTWISGDKPVGVNRPLLNGAIVAAVWAYAIMSIPSGPSVQKAYNQRFPSRLAAQIQPQWRVMNAINLGGWLALHHKPEFIDTRYDTFDHHGVLASFIQARSIHNTLAILDQYRIDHVLFKKNTPLVYLLLHSGGWKQLGEQNGFVLLARTSP